MRSVSTVSNRKLRAALISAGILMAVVAVPASGYDWLQFNGDAAHHGNNVQEKVLGPANVGTLAQRWQATLPASADGAPVLVRNVVTASGRKDLVFVTTTAGHLVALDALTGGQVWAIQHGPGACQINNVGGACFTTSSPAVDPSRSFVYSYGLDGYVHKHQVGDGTEVTGGGWPALATLKGYDEKGSSALGFATVNGVTYLYVAHGGYPGDNGDYQGHVTAINLATGAQAVFNAMCSDKAMHLAHNDANCPSSQRSAVWARPGVIYDAQTNRLFAGTGNGSFNGNAGGHNWSESVLAIHPDGTGGASGLPLDSYTPTNFQSLDNQDADLGSTAPAVLSVPAASTVRTLGVQSGKDAQVRLLNLANLSAAGGPGQVGGQLGIIGVPQGGGVVTQPAAWVNPADGTPWAMLGNGSGVGGVRLQLDGSGNPSLVAGWNVGQSATSPLIANNVVYVAGGGRLRALAPLSGAQLWSAAIGGVHWQSPVVDNGVLYVLDNNAHLTAFAPGSAAASAGVDFNFNRQGDLAWHNAGTGATAVWLMNGVSASAAVVVNANPQLTLLGSGDFDGDGHADLLWRNTGTGQFVLWLMNGTTTTSSAALPATSALAISGVADFNGDGRADIVWHDSTSGATGVWIMNGTAVAGSGVLSYDPNWVVTHTGDFDGDGRADVLWRNTSTGQTAVSLMAGTSASSTAVILGDPNWSVTLAADLDGDGKDDLVWRNAATGATAVWLMDGVIARKTAILSAPAGWTVTHAADVDGDGRRDLAWYNAATGQTALWLMDGVVGTSAAVVLTSPAWTVTHVSDADGDGKADLVWTNGSTGATAVWLMNGLAPKQAAVVFTDPSWRVVDLH